MDYSSLIWENSEEKEKLWGLIFVNAIILICNIDVHLSQKLVQGPGLGSDHTGGQRLAPCPPDHHIDEEDGEGDEQDDV